MMVPDVEIEMDVVMHNIGRWYRRVKTVRSVKQTCAYPGSDTERVWNHSLPICGLIPACVWVAVVYSSLGRAVS